MLNLIGILTGFDLFWCGPAALYTHQISLMFGDAKEFVRSNFTLTVHCSLFSVCCSWFGVHCSQQMMDAVFSLRFWLTPLIELCLLLAIFFLSSDLYQWSRLLCSWWWAATFPGGGSSQRTSHLNFSFSKAKFSTFVGEAASRETSHLCFCRWPPEAR